MTSFKSNNKLEKILCNLAHDNLPTFFLEGFKKNLSLTLSINWPKKPKFIFTSNNFETDEIFKLYSAINIEKKNKIYCWPTWKHLWYTFLQLKLH